MIKKIGFVMHPVKDMARARNFYENLLSLKPGSIYLEGKWVEYDLPEGGCLALTDYAGLEPSSTSGGSLAFEVDHIDELVTDLKSKGVTFKMDLTDTPVCHMAVLVDSEGNGFMLHQLKR